MQGRDTKPGAKETSKTVLRKFPRKSNTLDFFSKYRKGQKRGSCSKVQLPKGKDGYFSTKTL